MQLSARVAVLSAFASLILMGTPALALAATNTTVTVAPASAIYGGTVNLSATLTKNPGGAIVSGKTIFFTIDNVPVGSATTDVSGVATLANVPVLTLIKVGVHHNYIGAAFIGSLSPALLGDTGSADLTVTQKALTVTGTITADPKPYDSTTSATIHLGVLTLSGVKPFDHVTLGTAFAIGTFTPDGNVGTGKTVQISGMTISGSDANNYSLTQPTTQADIKKADQTFTFGTLSDKTFGDADFAVSASSNSTGVTAFTGSGTCVVNGSIVHLYAIGQCTISASNPGDINYNAAGPITQSFNVAAPAGTDTVYNAIPDAIPNNVASLGYEAQSTFQFGDYIHLAGTKRLLNTVTVTMSDWAVYSDYVADIRYSGNSVTWIHPITINIYSNHLGANGVPDTLLATKTEDVTIPWRPVTDPTCTGSQAGDWRGSDGNCHGGIAFNATFDLSSLNVIVPNDVIVGIAYNTADYGSAPIHLAGPYNSLNVGADNNQAVSVGHDDNVDNVFWNTSFAAFYHDGGASGVGTFRTDTAWTPNGTVNLQVTASPVTTSANTIIVKSENLDTTSSNPATVAGDGLNKWFMYNDTNDTIDNTLGYFVEGPSAAPAGSGSVQFTLGATPLNRKNIATYQFAGTMLNKISAMSFSAYSHSGVAGATESPYLNFNVDFTGSNSFQSRLVYVPGQNGAVPQDAWNTFDTINGGNAKWNYSGAKWPVTAVGPDAGLANIPGTTLRTWSAILQDYPNARILSTDGWLGVRVGEPGPTNYTANIDKFVIGIQTGGNINTATYDFEPSTGTLQINKYVCPIGTTVTRVANGVGGIIPTGCVPQQGATFGYVHGSQVDANAPYPELGQTFTVAGTTDGSGVISDTLSATGRYLVAETDSLGNQLAANVPLGLYCTGDGDTSGNNDNQELTFVTPSGTTHCVAYNQATLPAPAPVSPADGTITTTLNQQLIDWTDVGADDLYQPITYIYQASNGSATNPDGSFVTTVYTSSALSASQIATPNTSAGTYYWHVYAQDNNGNKSPWSVTWSVTVTNPAVTTDAANPVNSLDATLNGTNGITAADNTSFWYGTTSAGPFTSAADPSAEFPAGWTHDNGLGSAGVGASFNEFINNLSPNTTYYFAAWSQIGGIWYPGDVLSFNTANGPTPSVTTNAATAVDTTDATLNGTDGSLAADDTSFWWGPSAAGPFTSAADPSAQVPAGWSHDSGLGLVGAAGSFNEPLSSLTPNTTYTFVAWVHVGGIWYPGTTLNFNTEDTAPVISNEHLSTTPTTATITWDTDHNSTSRVVYDTVSHTGGTAPNYGYAFSTVKTDTPANTLGVIHHTVTVTGLTTGTTYFFRPVSEGSPESTGDELSGTPDTPTLPVIVITPDTQAFSGTIGVPFLQTFTADDGNGDTFNMSEVGDLPDGLSTSTTPTTVTISGTPTTISGPFSFSIGAASSTNPGNFSSYGYTISIGDVPPTAPTTLPDTASTNMNTPVTIDVLANDTGATGVTNLGLGVEPANGAVTIEGTEVIYTPNTGFAGTDTFTYQAHNGIGNSTDTIVTVTVTDTTTPVLTVVGNNPAYIATGATYSDQGVTVTDTPTDNLAYSVVLDGTATTTSFVLDTSTAGTHTVDYSATDGGGNTGIASRTIIVLDAPTVALTSTSALNTSDNPIHVTATFSEDVQGFTSADVSVTNGTVTNFQISSSTEATFDVIPAGNGGVVVTVEADSFQNLANGSNTATGEIDFNYAAPTTTTTTSSGGGGGNGPPVGGGGGGGGSTATALPNNGGAPTGQVLGASTSTVPTSGIGGPTCDSTALLTKYMRMGQANDPVEVTKLQTFLNGEMLSGLPLTGFFGSMTTAAVKAFQTKYAMDILAPWGLTQPTGYVYKLTLWKVNGLICASLNAPMPTVTQ